MNIQIVFRLEELLKLVWLEEAGLGSDWSCGNDQYTFYVCCLSYRKVKISLWQINTEMFGYLNYATGLTWTHWLWSIKVMKWWKSIVCSVWTRSDWGGFQTTSVIHSMVKFSNGAVLAQISLPDMKLPNWYVLYYLREKNIDVVNGLIYKELRDYFWCAGYKYI